MPVKAARRGGRIVGVFTVFAVFGFVAASNPAARDQQRSASFWAAATVDGMSAVEFASLDELVAATDLAVVGRMTKVDKGREWLAAPELQGSETAMMAMARFATVTIVVDTVLTGVAPGPEIEMEVFLPHPSALGELQASRPVGRAVFFLHEKQEPGLANVYRLVSDTDAYFQDDGGRVATPHLDHSPLATELTGLSFEGMQDRVRALAGLRNAP